MNYYERRCHNNFAKTLCEKWILDSVYMICNQLKVICKKIVLKFQKIRFDHFLWTLVIFTSTIALMNVCHLREHSNDVVYEPGKLDYKCLLGNVTDRIKTQYPVIVWWTYIYRQHSESIVCPNNKICHLYINKDRLEPVDVRAYMFYAPGIKYNKLPLPRQPDKIIWAVYNEESPKLSAELCHDEGLKLFNYSATFSRHSDVPYPLQFMRSLDDITSKDFFLETSIKNKLLKDISPILYLQTNCNTHTERDDYVRELMKFIPIDSYGPCVKNKDLPKSLTKDYLDRLYFDENLKFIARYKFVIAIENAVCDDYVTEKFWRPIYVGVVPIYFGSPKIRDWFPNKNTAILLNDYRSPQILTAHIQTLLRNDSMYEEYLEHKTKGIITNKRLSYEIRVRPYQVHPGDTLNKFECFICEKLHDLKTQCKANKVVNTTHQNCPKPPSALTLAVNPSNLWVKYYDRSKQSANEILQTVMNETTCRI